MWLTIHTAYQDHICGNWFIEYSVFNLIYIFIVPFMNCWPRPCRRLTLHHSLDNMVYVDQQKLQRSPHLVNPFESGILTTINIFMCCPMFSKSYNRLLYKAIKLAILLHLNSFLQIGILQDDYTALGVLCAVLFFPLGILCCLALKQRRCSNCGAIFG